MMKSQLSHLQVLGFFLLYAALGFLLAIFNISLNPFVAAPFWIVTLALAVLLIGLVLSLMAGRFTRKFKLTRLQWLGLGLLSLVLFMGTYLLTTHGTNLLGAFPGIIGAFIGFGMQLWPSRSQKSSYGR